MLQEPPHRVAPTCDREKIVTNEIVQIGSLNCIEELP